MPNKNVIPSTVNAAKIDSTIKYQTNGLLVMTNDTAVVPRNEAGSIQVEDGATTPVILVIEPMIKRVTTKSALKVLNTQFNYYKFPARTALAEEPDLDLDLDLSILNEFNELTENTVPKPTPQIPAEYVPSDVYILPEGNFANMFNIDLNTVIEGPAQTKPGKFVITQDLLDELETAWVEQNLTASLSVTGKITTKYNNKGAGDRNSEVGFRLNYGDGSNYPSRFRMSQPKDDIKDFKAKKDGTYITFVNAVIPYKDSEGNVLTPFTLGNEWSIMGYAEDSTAKIYHEILPGDTSIRFDLTEWTSAT
jgi:hypothetical protein